MRLLTGDELGLLKEIIPETCRPPPVDSSGRPLDNGWLSNASQFKRPRPSATSIQSLANSYSGGNNGDNDAVTRLDNGEMTRERGVVSLSFIKDGASDDSFQFAALRINGTVEKWTASRVAGYVDDNDRRNSEANVTPARYTLVSSIQDVFQYEEENKVSEDEGDNANNKGWYHSPPIKPIGVSSTITHNKSILTAADSSGNISILNSSLKLLTRYNAYSNVDDTKEGAVLTYTKGQFANRHVMTCCGVNGNKVAVGGRERGVRVLDLERGDVLWKVSCLDCVDMCGC